MVYEVDRLLGDLNVTQVTLAGGDRSYFFTQ